MWSRTSLRARVILVVLSLVFITIGGGVTSIVYTYWMNARVEKIIDHDIQSLVTAQDLAGTLMMQKGYVSYYFLDGNPAWLERLAANNKMFLDRLIQARLGAASRQEIAILARIEGDYVRYDAVRAQVIDYYKSGSEQVGFELHQKIRPNFFTIVELCASYRDIHLANIVKAQAEIRSRARLVQYLSLAAIPLASILGVFLAYVLISQVLVPLRRLALEAEGHNPGGDRPGMNEIEALSLRVHSLISDVDQAMYKLEWSREHLVQSEKWALVGKLAASVAHSIRNPFTSVKMRLFSLERTLELTASQKEDFEVVGDEIKHIDHIIRNFLEFSRPPKLKIQKMSPSRIIDQSLQLLEHRFEAEGVRISLNRDENLPEVELDPEQIKEVVVNIMVNACEAMVAGGHIRISEAVEQDPQLGMRARIEIQDDGPGITALEAEKVFQPFFSTKEEGTGLGLAIAARVVGEHGGAISLEAGRGKGAKFTIILPFKVNGDE